MEDFAFLSLGLAGISATAAAVIGGVVAGGLAAAGTAIGASIQAKGAAGAARTQAQAMHMATLEEQRQYDETTETLAPYVEAGYGGLAELQDLLGVDRYEKYFKSKEVHTYDDKGQMIVDEQGNPVMRTIGVEDKRLVSDGQQAQARELANLESSPLYQALARQGEAGILQNAAAAGVRGGAVSEQLAKYRPQMLMGLLNDRYQKLMGLTSMGQAAAARQAGYSAQHGQAMGNLYAQQGTALAQGQLAGAGARAGMVQNLGSIASTLAPRLINYFANQGGTSGAMGAAGGAVGSTAAGLTMRPGVGDLT